MYYTTVSMDAEFTPELVNTATGITEVHKHLWWTLLALTKASSIRLSFALPAQGRMWNSTYSSNSQYGCERFGRSPSPRKFTFSADIYLSMDIYLLLPQFNTFLAFWPYHTHTSLSLEPIHLVYLRCSFLSSSRQKWPTLRHKNMR